MSGELLLASGPCESRSRRGNPGDSASRDKLHRQSYFFVGSLRYTRK